MSKHKKYIIIWAQIAKNYFKWENKCGIRSDKWIDIYSLNGKNSWACIRSVTHGKHILSAINSANPKHKLRDCFSFHRCSVGICAWRFLLRSKLHQIVVILTSRRFYSIILSVRPSLRTMTLHPLSHFITLIRCEDSEFINEYRHRPKARLNWKWEIYSQ